MNSFFKGKFQDKVLLMFIIPLVLFGSFAVDVYGDTLTHITSISEIGMPEGSIDSHAGYWGSSRLELNYREQSTIDPSTLVSSRNIYSRVKKISSTGKYLLLWQNEQIGSIIRYSLSSDSSLSSWDKGKILFDKTTMTFNEAGFAKQEITKSYTNADAVVLGDGKTILAVASFRAGKVGDYSLLGNKRYALLNKYCGIDLRYSTDGGVTWSDIQRVYTGYNWEPSFHVVDDNTVQVYFSQVAVAMEHTGIEHSTGVAMFTLTKNGTGWVSDSVPVNGRSFSKTTTVFKFPAKRLDTNKVIKTLGVDNKYHTRMTGQMPSVLKLNNGNAVIAAESVYRETASGKDKFKISFAFNKDEFFPHVPLGVAGSDAVKCNGSCSMRLYSFNGAAPYIGQFRSGETVISYNEGGTYKVRLGSSSLKSISGNVYKLLPKAKHGYWGSIQVDQDTGSVISAGHGNMVDNCSGNNKGGCICSTSSDGKESCKPKTNIYLSRSYLNHAINVGYQSIRLDGNASDWMTKEHLFIGEKTQAQALYRFATDSNNLYIVSEVLDNVLVTNKDTQLIYLGTDSKNYYKIQVSSKGLLKAVKVVDGDINNPVEVSGIQATAQKLENGALNENGYVVEVAIPLSLLGSDLSKLRVNPILYNSDDENVASVSDIINYTNSQKFSTWIPLIMNAVDNSNTFLKCSESSSQVDCKVYLTDRNEKVPDEVALDLSYDNLSFLKCTPNTGITMNCNNSKYILISGFSSNVMNKQEVGTISFKKTSVSGRVRLNYYNVHYNNNGTKNNQWLFIGDSFFDYLDGVVINRRAGAYDSSRPNNSNPPFSKYGYMNYTSIKTPAPKAQNLSPSFGHPSLGNIYSFGVAGITLKDYRQWFLGLTDPKNYYAKDVLEYLSKVEGEFPDPASIKKVAIYLGTNDVAAHRNGSSYFTAADASKYMDALIGALNTKYNNPQIYLVKLMPRTEAELSLLKEYNAVYKEKASMYSNVEFVDTDKSFKYADNDAYNLIDSSDGLIKDKYYAKSSATSLEAGVNAGIVGHIKISYYKYWVNNLREKLHMNFSEKLAQEYYFDVTGSTTAPVINLSTTNLILKDEDTATLTASISPATISQEVSFKSEDETIAAVDSNGKIKALKVGETTIVVTSKANPSITASCKVRVRPIEVLFVGNSKTNYPSKVGETDANISAKIPRKFQAIAQGSGYDVNWTFAYQSAASLLTIYNNAQQVSKMKGAYDYAVLQEKTGSYISSDLTEYYNGVSSIGDLLTSYNPNIRLFIRKLWVEKNSTSEVINQAYTNTDTIISRLKPKYNIGIVNDGRSFYDVVQNHSDIAIFHTDNSHQSEMGAYFSALCIYSTLFNEDPTTVTINLDVSDADASILKSVAKKHCYNG